MYRDPSEFRERFKAYKDGKSVREIYGLPGYEPGKLPIEEMMPYILAVENPTRQGLVNGVWRPPTDSTKWDVHAIGGGLDIRAQHNPIVYNYLKTNGRLASPFLTAREEEVLREKVFKKTMLPALQNVYNKYGDKISSKGYARLAGMKWQGHPFLMAISPDSVTGKAFIKAIESGDKDLDSVFDAYYKYPANAKRYAARILADTNYWKNHNTVATKPVPQEPIIARQDATRVATTIPQEKTIPIADPRNATIAEALRAMWAHTAFENMPKISDMPIWESPSLPALTPVEYDVTPLKTYSKGKLPGYLKGLTQLQIEETIVKNQGTIQQGHYWSPLSTVANSVYRDYRKPFAQLFTEGGLGNFARGLQQLFESLNKEARGIADLTDHANVLLDILTGVGGKITKDSAKELIKNTKKAAKNAIKPAKASVKTLNKFNTSDPNVVGSYYKSHPEEVTPITNSKELLDVVDFVNEYTAPRYKRLNKTKMGLNVSDVKLGYADLSGTNLGGYAGPNGEIVLNKDVVGNSLLVKDILAHEVAGHRVNLLYPINAQQASALQYGLPFKLSYLDTHSYINTAEEQLAIYRLLYNVAHDDLGLTGKALDLFMSKPPEAWLKRVLPRIGYGDKIMWRFPDLEPLGQVSRIVPTTGAGIYLAGNEEYKNGKLPGYFEGELPMGEKKQLTDEEVRLIAYASPHELPLSPSDPVMEKFVEIVGGGKFLKLLKGAFAERLIRDYKHSYKEARQNGWGRSASKFIAEEEIDNPALNILDKEFKILDLFNNGKLPGYSNGKIRIKPSKRGTFTAAAKKHGASVREFESRVLKNPEKYSKAMVRKALFSRNARSWKH